MKKVYIVWEDTHGDVSYWLDRDKAMTEVNDIIAHMYNDENDTYEDIFGIYVGIKETNLDDSWISVN